MHGMPPYEEKIVWRKPKNQIEGTHRRGPSLKPWMNMRRQVHQWDVRHHKQMQIMAECNIGEKTFNRKFHVWQPKRELFNFYKGPDSHPDNPWFPAFSAGFGSRNPKLRPRKSWDSEVSTSLTTAVQPTTSRSTFVGDSAVSPVASHAVRGAGSALSAVALRAHKKAATSTKWQGKKGNRHKRAMRGIQKQGYPGHGVESGEKLVTQRGCPIKAGAYVSMNSKTYTLYVLMVMRVHPFTKRCII